MATSKKKKTRKSASRRADRKRSSGGPAKGKGTAKGIESVSYVLITLLVVVLANVALHFVRPIRFDMTQNRLYSLSQGSERLVAELEDDMEITAYFTSELPPPFNATELYVRNLLAEYEAASNGRLQVRFVDPDDEEEREAAQRDGVQEVPHQLIENDSVSVMNGYRGIVIRYIGQRQTIPVIQDTRGLEYEITQAIRLLVREPLPVGVMEGHGSPTLAEGLSTLRSNLPHYELSEVDVSEEIDRNLRALLIVNPTEEISETELRRINQYVMNGGSLGVFGGAMNVDIQGAGPSASASSTGINTLLNAWGMDMGESLVADARCGNVPMPTRLGLRIPVPYPPMPIVLFDDDAQAHPALFRLPQGRFFFASPIEVRDQFHELDGQILARSSGEDQSWLLTGDSIALQPRDPSQWTLGGERGPHNLMVAICRGEEETDNCSQGTLPSAFPEAAVSGEESSDIEAPAESTGTVRVLVAGTSSIVRDEFLPQQQQRVRGGSEIAMALNMVDWLAADADLIAIRAKNIEDPALDVPQAVTSARDEAIDAAEEAQQTGDTEAVDDAIERYTEAQEDWENKKLMYRLGITFGLPLFILLFGLLRWQLRSSKRASLEELRKNLAKKNRKSRKRND